MILLTNGALNKERVMDLKTLYNNANENFVPHEIGELIQNVADATIFNGDKEAIKYIITLYVNMENDGRFTSFKLNSKEHIVYVAVGRIFDREMAYARKGEYIPIGQWCRLISENKIEFVNI